MGHFHACHAGSHQSFSLEALPASFEDCSRHSAREYIVNSRDAAMSFIWYAS